MELLGKEGKQLDGNWKELGLIEIINSNQGAEERITGTLGNNPFLGSIGKGVDKLDLIIVLIKTREDKTPQGLKVALGVKVAIS